MGNCCGKQSSSDDPFAGPARQVGDRAQQQNQAPGSGGGGRATIPAAKIPGQAPAPTVATGPASAENDAERERRAQMAKAADDRATKRTNSGITSPDGGGKLAKDLAAQRKQTNNQTLTAAAEETRRQREVDQTTVANRMD